MVADDIFSCATELGEEDGVFTVATNLGEGEGGLIREPDDLVILAAWVAVSCHGERWSSCEMVIILSAPCQNSLTHLCITVSTFHLRSYGGTVGRYWYCL